MFTEAELTYILGCGYETSDGMIHYPDHDMPSLQLINAQRNARNTDWNRSLLLFIARRHLRVPTRMTAANYIAFDVQLVRPLSSEDSTHRYPGMVSFSFSIALAMLMGKPFHREKDLIVLDCEPDTLVQQLKAYIEQPDLRLPFSVSY